ncbi:MAG: hypothetical protein HY243_04825 [Proteobacteria bacterium]|nr:hypothetical protein [Pseudomonadota bacterium]
MSDDHHEQSALLREWRVAQITLVVGFIIALGVGGYFIWQSRSTPSEVPATTTERAQPPVQQTPADNTAANLKAGAEVCQMALKHATDFGIIPGYSKLVALQPEGTDVKGRYACLAATPAARYLIAIDLVCRDFKKNECVNLFSVTQEGGAVLYQRAN